MFGTATSLRISKQGNPGRLDLAISLSVAERSDQCVTQKFVKQVLITKHGPEVRLCPRRQVVVGST